MPNIQIAHNLLSFPALTKSGVFNAMTYGNTEWGNMSLATNPDVYKSYLKILSTWGIQKKEIIRMKPDHNDNVQFLTKENLKVYGIFNQKEISGVIEIDTDAIVTKEHTPIALGVADCAVVVTTGIDKKDGRRFIVFVHAGFSGTYLDLHRKALRLAKLYYSFKPEDLDAFIFPFIGGSHYQKPKKGNRYKSVFESHEWISYVDDYNDAYGIHFGKKIEDDLHAYGIKNIQTSKIDSYEAHTDNLLYSYTYAKEIGRDVEKRSGILVSL